MYQRTPARASSSRISQNQDADDLRSERHESGVEAGFGVELGTPTPYPILPEAGAEGGQGSATSASAKPIVAAAAAAAGAGRGAARSSSIRPSCTGVLHPAGFS